MFVVDQMILVGAVLLLGAVVSSKLSVRAGVPVLIVFIAVGMLAGEDGIGRIAFDDFRLAHAIGTLALAVILFDGGLRTPFSAVREAGAPALLLASVGVILTAVVTAAAAVLLLDIGVIEALLLGSIVGSTDAAAVFSLLRAGGLQVRSRLAATVEIESGSNDPMAVLLTLLLVQAALGELEGPGGVAFFLARQVVLGLAVGIGLGRLASHLVRRIRLEAATLYPILVGTSGLLAYGVAAAVGGNGFLAVYVAGMVLGNRPMVFRQSTLLLHDGFAWIAQMVMFILLGLLSTPGDLLAVAGDGLLVALALILVARPVAVFATLLPFSFSWREKAFLSWAGLKGAVPIILATYPLMFGVPDAELLFDLVFFVVLASALAQGWTLMPVAGWLGVREPARPSPPIALELTSLKDVDGDIVDYLVTENSRVAGRRVRDIALVDGALVAVIIRGDQVLPPRGSSTLTVGDHVFVVTRPGVRHLVDGVFAEGDAVRAPPPSTEFPLAGTVTVEDLLDFYGVEIGAAPGTTLDALLHASAPGPVEVGTETMLGSVRLRVTEMVDGAIEWVGLSVVELDDPDDET